MLEQPGQDIPVSRASDFMDQWQRTKVVATVGPSCETEIQLIQLVEAGVDVVRLNLSHGVVEDHQQRLKMVREISQNLSQPVGVLIDLCGPKIRIGKFAQDHVQLISGEHFTITTDTTVLGDSARVSCTYPNLAEEVQPGDDIFLADGLLHLIVEKVEPGEIRCLIETGGELSSGKGVNLPGTNLSTPSLTTVDRRNLEAMIPCRPDFVALSFVRTADDIRQLKTILKDAGSNAKVVAKIEKPEAIKNLDEILQETDVVMVARGDLGIETSVEAMPVLQKDILFRARQAGVPVIVATQMLESMVLHPRPTRAEATDVANAVWEGTDAVMLSGETAAGAYPLQSVKTMTRIVSRAEQAAGFYSSMECTRKQEIVVSQTTEAVAYAAAVIAQQLHIKAICAFTRSGRSALMLSRARPPVPIIALTPSQEVYQQMNLLWGVLPVICPFQGSFEAMLSATESVLLGMKLFQPGEEVCLVMGMPPDLQGTTNSIHVMCLGQNQ